MSPAPAGCGAPVLAVSGAAAGYAGRPVLRGVDLAVRAGEIYALLGANGAGKTTLVRAVCGRLPVGRGTVAVAGFDPRADRRARAATGLVPQEVALHPRLTGRENLAAFARLAGVGRGGIARAVEAAMGLTRAGPRADEPVLGLSGGWQRRFNVAAGVVHAPKLLVLDEPTVGVDLDARAAVRDALLSLRRAGTAILLVTHDIAQAESVADRVGILAEGRLAREGSLDELLAAAPGGRRRAGFALTRPLEPDRARRLARCGLRVAPGGMALTAEAIGDYATAAALAAQLEARGIAVAAVELRPPSIADLLAAAPPSARAAGAAP